MPERVPDINLLPKYERESASLFYIFITFLVITIIGYGVIGSYYFTTKSKLAEAETKYTELSDQAETLRIQVAQLESGGIDLEQSVLFAENYDMPTSYLVEELNDLLPDDGYLVDYTYSNRVADIVTHFESLNIVAEYTTELLSSEFVTDTKLSTVDSFTLREDEHDDEQFTTIPRYEAKYTLNINRQHLKGDLREDE